MEACCTIESVPPSPPGRCPQCGEPGRPVDSITPKALLRSPSLARLSAPEHRFCATPGCLVVYFGHGETFLREDVLVPVFQKESAGDRTICYCFGITEADIQREIAESGRSTASERITALVKAGRCACEVRNPQGRCCLGNVATLRTPRASREHNAV